MKRILITSCSQRKRKNENLLPAIERYDGPNFQLLRKYLSLNDDEVDVYILSAKYGLISHTARIPFYDKKLNDRDFEKLTGLLLLQTDHIFNQNKKRTEVFINLGRLYLKVFEPTIKKLKENNSLIFTGGSSGRRLAEMYDWLYKNNSPLRNEQTTTKAKEVLIQGIRLQTNEKEIQEIIQNEIAQNGTKDLQNFQSWFVPFDEIKVSPKWLISRLTGLPVSKFHSDQARKVLLKLGIKVQRL